MNRRIAIVGAGLGGLSAALALSGRPELEIVVLEAAARPGGKMGLHHFDGVFFDTGPSLLTLPSIPAQLLADRGYDLDTELDLFRPKPLGRYHFGDATTLDVGSSPEATQRNVEQSLGTKAAREFGDFLGYARRIWEAASPHFVLGPSPTVLTPLSMGLSAIRAFRDIDPASTMYEGIRRHVTDPRLRDLFLRYATFNGSDPRCAPATLNCIAWVDLGLGGWGVRGGMYELTRMLERLARREGVQFQYEQPVVSISRNQKGFELRCPQDTIAADAVVSNADVRHLIGDLWSGKPPRKLESKGPLSTSGWTALLRARRRKSPRRPAHTVVFPRRAYLEEFADLFDRRRPPSEPTIYLCAREKAHAASGWDDHEPLFLMTNAPPVDRKSPPVDWGAHETGVLQRLREIELIDECDEVVWRRTPRQLASRFPGTRGSLYGAASNSRFSAFTRPPNRVPGIDGLYLATGSAHPGGGVPLCIQSGRRAAAEVLEDL